MAQSLYIDKEGTLLLIEAPGKPDYNEVSQSGHSVMEAGLYYDKALQESILKGIPFKDQRDTNVLLFHAGSFDKVTKEQLKGKIFPIPSGYTAEMKEECGLPNPMYDHVCKNVANCICVHDGIKKQVAILTPSQPSEKEPYC